MIANAHEAVEALRHRRTGEVLPTKSVARNTKLVYYADELVGLKFHNTIIAKFTTNGAVIDTRDSFGDPGWFTITTWERINEFTRARTFTNNGLRYIDTQTGDGAALYMHGTTIDANGRVLNVPLEPEIGERISAIVCNLPAKIRRHAEKVIARWVDWGEPSNCCGEARLPILHSLAHVERNEYAVPPELDGLAQSLRSVNVWGDRLRNELTKRFREHLRDSLIPAAVQAVAPDFPYPQLERRRT